ncbi:glycerate kinase [Escherichia coli]
MDECDPRLANCHIEVACDVDNPLVGARGAAAVFQPQKRGNAGDGRRTGTGAAKLRPCFTTAN